MRKCPKVGEQIGDKWVESQNLKALLWLSNFKRWSYVNKTQWTYMIILKGKGAALTMSTHWGRPESIADTSDLNKNTRAFLGDFEVKELLSQEMKEFIRTHRQPVASWKHNPKPLCTCKVRTILTISTNSSIATE